MTTTDYQDVAEALCALCHRVGARGWCRATSGNFSARVHDDRFLITRSGVDKSQLDLHDLLLCDSSGNVSGDSGRVSAETPLHVAIYSADSSISAVLHTHSIASTVLSRAAGESLAISGFEMQKAISGIHTHESSLEIPVYDNTQDMDALANTVSADSRHGRVPGFLVRGHGLYTWGSDLAEAERHLDGIEFLLECVDRESRP